MPRHPAGARARPLRPEGLKADRETAHARAGSWLREVANARLHATTGEVPQVRLVLERERLQAMYLAMLHKLMSYCETRADYVSGLQYGARALRYDRAHERTHRHLMRMLYLQGDRTAALRQYERCVSALKEELDVSPTERTRALYQRIRAERSARSRVASEQTTAREPERALLPHMLERLKQMQTLLNQLPHPVQQEIHSVEHRLSPSHR